MQESSKISGSTTRIGTIVNPVQLAVLLLVLGMMQDARVREEAVDLLTLLIHSTTPEGYWSALEEASGKKFSMLTAELVAEFLEGALGETYAHHYLAKINGAVSDG